MFSLAQTVLTTKLIPLLLAGVGFGLLITVHEFGHFIFCKLFDIGTPIFSIGFGPRLIHKQIGETNFRLSLIPLGGYCLVQGAEEAEVVDMTKGTGFKFNPKRSFEVKPYWQKLLVMLGGIMFNIMFAYVAFTAIHVGSRPKLQTELQISHILADSAAQKAGIAKQSTLVGYNDITFSTAASALQPELKMFLKTIADSPSGTIVLHTKNEDGQPCDKEVTLGGQKGSVGTLGVSIEMKNTPLPGLYEYDSLSSALVKGIAMTHQWIAQTAQGILGMFRRRSLQSVGGPIAMFSQTFKMAQDGFRSFLNFLGIISIGLALLNLVPLGALDGGQLLFVTIEAIIRRRLPDKLKEYIIIGSWILFMLLVVVLSYRDIVRLFS